MRKLLLLLLMLASSLAHGDAQRKLDDGTIAQGIVTLTSAGTLTDRAPVLQLDQIDNFNNYYPDKSRGFTFGKRTGIDNTIVDLWEGPTARYVFPTAPMQMSVVSTSASDAAAGTGVQRLYIHYLDDQYAIKFVIVTMNGTTPVLTVPTNILRINGVHSAGTGTGGGAAGNISVTAVGGAVTYGYITAGNNTARQAIYTVPDGYWGYMKHWQQSSGSSGNHFCQMTLTATTHEGILYPGTFLIQDEQGSQNGGTPITFPLPIAIPPRSDVKISAISDAGAANVTALGAVMGWFEKIQ